MASLKPNQKPTEKPSLPPSFIERVQNGVDAVLKTLFSVEKGWYKELSIVKNNYALGVKYYNKGELRDAIWRLRLVVWLEPTHAGAWYCLGRAYMDSQKPLLAQQAYRQVVKLKPDSKEAAYIMSLSGDKTTAAIRSDNTPAA